MQSMLPKEHAQPLHMQRPSLAASFARSCSLRPCTPREPFIFQAATAAAATERNVLRKLACRNLNLFMLLQDYEMS